MTLTVEDREKLAFISLETAMKHQRELNGRAELSCLSSAATSLLGVSLVRFDNAEPGIQYLRNHDGNLIIRRIA